MGRPSDHFHVYFRRHFKISENDRKQPNRKRQPQTRHSEATATEVCRPRNKP